MIDGALEMYCMGLAEQNDPHLEYGYDAQEAIIEVLESNFSGRCKVRPDLGVYLYRNKKKDLLAGNTFNFCCPMQVCRADEG